MSEQDGMQAFDLEPPNNLNPFDWRRYWESQGQLWRTEPEINRKRQMYLIQRLSIGPIVEQGIFPFKNVKLTRADVEWLLATLDNGRGPIDWKDEKQRERKGLDLRGADLREVDLSRLPLLRLNGGAGVEDEKQFEAAAIHLERANLVYARLEEANLYGAYLECANLSYSVLISADFQHAHLEGAKLGSTNCKSAYFDYAHLEGANFNYVHLEGASLDNAFFDNTTNLYGVLLSNKRYGGVHLADIHWGDTNLAVVEWSALSKLGNELAAQMFASSRKNKRGFGKRFYSDYKNSVRAYRQLAVVLRNQGLNEDAARFSYRAQLLQRKVFWYQRKIGQYLFSLFIDLLAGYGYKAWRSFLTYVLVIGIFAFTYHQLSAHLAWNEAIVISMTAFHGRGFFPDQFHPGDPQALVAAIEAFVGLLIEVTFIATLTQRLFGK